MEVNIDTSGQSGAPDIEAQARNLGWTPREEFRGDQTKWVDAETFVERGQTIMPILKSTNKRLEQQLHAQAAELDRMKNMFNASQESIAELQKVHAEATKMAVERARNELKAQLKEAKLSGDVDAELAIQDQITDLNDQVKNATKPTPVEPTQQTTQNQQPALHPDFAAWQQENAWFGTDERKTLRAMGIAQELRADPELDNLQGKAFFDKILEVMNERTGGPRTSKVGESRPSGGSGGGGSGGKSYNSLPPDAKETCDRQGRKLVGEGRAFKDMDAWRKYYTNLYYQGETA